MSKEKKDFRAEFLAQMLALIEACTAKGVNWLKPFVAAQSHDMPCNPAAIYTTGKPYVFTGSNRFRFMLAAMAYGYSTPCFISGRYARNNQIWFAKGAMGHLLMVPHWKPGNTKADRPDWFSWERYYNLDQLNSKDHRAIRLRETWDKWLASEKANAAKGTLSESDRVAHAQKIVDDYVSREKIEITNQSGKACYWPSYDRINMPPIGDFDNAAAYYSVWFHEMAHSTGHANRLDREGITKGGFWGDHRYSVEELVAEFGAALLMAEIGLVAESKDNSAAYLAHWAKEISAKPEILASAFSQSTRAVDFITGKRAAAKDDAEAA